MKVLGFILLLLFVIALFRMYHAFMAEMYREELNEILDKRFRKEIEFRWANQDVVVHQRLVISDETNR